MEIPVFAIILFIQTVGFTQNIQLHYDPRHSIDPEVNPRNFVSISISFDLPFFFSC